MFECDCCRRRETDHFMTIFVFALLILIVGGVLSWFFKANASIAHRIGSASALTACLLGLVSVCPVFFNGIAFSGCFAWGLPCESVVLEVDALSAL